LGGAPSGRLGARPDRVEDVVVVTSAGPIATFSTLRA
jgi:hypothetical protein